ncbi:MAG: NAD(P)/FAD-dependent oxidoreductase, partial [Candidatus Hydrothermarchaeaceae archaeon]
MKCDILVVGAGPAGSSAAKAAAERGAKTLLVDKKKRIGFPEQCGGAVASYLLSFLPFNLPRKFLNWEIDTLKFHADGITINRSGSSWTCYAIRRSELDAWLAEKAKDAGAELRINTELTNLQLEGERVVRATVKSHESEYEIEPKAVIAADGVSST